MSTIFSIFAIYMVVWWTVLFAVLPLGVTTYAEAGIEVKDGGDPGAPVDPKLKKKFFTTTWVSAIVFAIGYAVWFFHLIKLPSFPSG
jgi:predicted secreted protein